MAQEIERKFLVVGEYKQLAHTCNYMVQGYIASGRRTVRVRISDNRGWLTIKGPSVDGGITRFEWEKEITRDEARELLQLAEGPIIEKHRYLVEHQGHTFEVDEFHGENEGLTIAEIELSRADEEFSHPEWLGREVTGEKRFYNSHLRNYPYASWSDEHKQ